jgi:thiosulfate reductase cytochrome b subunit
MSSQLEPPSVDETCRHPLPVRLWHWITAATIGGLLFSGICILNVHPRLYWGEVGNEGTPAVIGIGPAGPALPGQAAPTELNIGRTRFDVTGWAGVPFDAGNDGTYFMIFNTPESWHFGGLRAWHFALAWVLVTAAAAYALYLFFSGRLRRMWLPTSAQLAPAAMLRDLWDHLRVRRVDDRQYNLLQKLAYLGVLGLLMPLILLTGLTMSAGVTLRFPELFSWFGGRESARTLHALAAALMMLFILVHVFQTFVAGLVNPLRSMLTGHYRVRKEAP